MIITSQLARENKRLSSLSSTALLREFKASRSAAQGRQPARPRVIMERALSYHALCRLEGFQNTVVNKRAEDAYAAQTVEDLIAAGILLARRAGMDEIISECPAFKKGHDAQAPECVACEREFNAEYVMCRAECQGTKAPPAVTPTAANPDGLAPFKPFRPGTQAALLVDLLKERKVVSFTGAADHLSQLLNAPKDKVLMNVKSYVGEWLRGKVNMKPTNLPFILVVTNDMITYQEKEKK